jgi:hypothetical protein
MDVYGRAEKEDFLVIQYITQKVKTAIRSSVTMYFDLRLSFSADYQLG